MDQKTLERLRPRDSSSGAIREALAAVVQEREAAEHRRALAVQARRQAMMNVSSTAKDIAAPESQAASAELDLERLDLIAPQLQTQLTAALAQEEAAAQQEGIEVARQAFATAAAAVEAALPAYQEHAAGIVRFCQLEQVRQAALVYFQETALQAIPVGAPNYGVPESGVTHVATQIGKHVVLPGLPGEPMAWGTLPPPPPPVPLFRYG